MRRIATAQILATLAVLAACSDDPTGAGPPVQTNQVAVRDDFFDPFTAVVNAGATVIWTWRGGNAHNVTWIEQNPPPGANSRTQASGTHQRTFATAGMFNYYCTIHGTPTSGMRGSVVVQ